MRTIKIKSRDFRETLAHPGAEPGSHGGYSIFSVENVPDATAAAEVLLWFRRIYVPLDQYVIDFTAGASA